MIPSILSCGVCGRPTIVEHRSTFCGTCRELLCVSCQASSHASECAEMQSRPFTGGWAEKSRETFTRDGSALVLEVGIEVAVKIKELSFACLRADSTFDERKWRFGLSQILGYQLPALHPGETYKMVIKKGYVDAASL